MKNIFLILLSLCLSASGAFAQGRTYSAQPQNNQAPVKLKKVTIAKKITVQLPEDFVPMPDEGIAVKYPAARKPLGVFTSPNGQIDFSVAEKQSTFSEFDLKVVKDVYKASIMRMFSEVQFIREEIKTQDKKEFIVFEFVSILKDENKNSNKGPIRKYTIIHYYLKGGNVTIFTFNVPFIMKEKWQPTANEVMNSIKISN